MPEPLYSDKDQPEPWFWHPDVQDIWWQVEELLKGTCKFHVITHTYHYATREAAIEDLKLAEAVVAARVTRTHPCQ